MVGKVKLWISWGWNNDLYYCKVPTHRLYEELKKRMDNITAADNGTYFHGMTLTQQEPQIGEYIPRKKLEFFLDNVENAQAVRDEHETIDSMQEMLDRFLMNRSEYER